MVAFVIAMLATVLFDGAATLLTAARAELAQMLGVLDRLVPAWRPAAGASRVGAGGDRLPPARREDRRLRHPRCAWSRRATTGSRRSTRALGGRQAVPGRRRPAPAGAPQVSGGRSRLPRLRLARRHLCHWVVSPRCPGSTSSRPGSRTTACTSHSSQPRSCASQLGGPGTPPRGLRGADPLQALESWVFAAF
jgi:hypothetical protein